MPDKFVGLVNPRVVSHAASNALRGLVPKKVARALADAANGQSGIGNIAKGFIANVTDPEEKKRLEYFEGEYHDPGYGFMLDDVRQRKYMEGLGYHLVDDTNYGMVNRATRKLMEKTGKVRVPIYQLGEDDIDPYLVTLVSTNPKEVNQYIVPAGRGLKHAGFHPKALYEDAEGNHYVKAWDLNDYGQHNGNIAGKFVDFVTNKNHAIPQVSGASYGPSQFLAEMYDYLGNPFVQRTGLIKVEKQPEDVRLLLKEFTNGLKNTKREEGGLISRMKEVYGDNALDAIREYKKGGKIHIAPSKRGTFTAAAKKHGKSVQAFASQVLAHKENYSPAMVKKANFARNAAKWHGEGGIIDRYGSEAVAKALASLRGNEYGPGGGMKSGLRGLVQSLGEARDAKIGAIGAQQIRDLQSEGRSSEADALARAYTKANVAGIAGATSVGAGSAISKALNFAGEAALPSTFLKGLGYYFPKAAGAIKSVSPIADAAAMSYWSAKGLREAQRAKQAGDTATSVGLRAVSLLPVAMPAYGAARRGIENLGGIEGIRTGLNNLKKYRELFSDKDAMLDGVRYAREKYINNADQLNKNRFDALSSSEQAGFPLGRVYNDASVLADMPQVRVVRNPLSFFSRNLGEFSDATKDIIMYPYQRRILAEAWKNPGYAYKRLKGVGAHEGTHWALDRLGANDIGVRPQSSFNYWTPNKNHPLYNEITWRFENPMRDLSGYSPATQRWMKSPEEFVAEATGAQYLRGIPANRPYSLFETKDREALNAFLEKRFKFEPGETDYILSGLSGFGYSSGGRIQ